MPVYKEDIEECKPRVYAWWNHEIIDRAVLQVRAPKNLLQRIQEAGKLMYAYCDKGHVEKLLTELKPEGLMLVVDGCNSSDEVEELR